MILNKAKRKKNGRDHRGGSDYTDGAARLAAADWGRVSLGIVDASLNRPAVSPAPRAPRAARGRKGLVVIFVVSAQVPESGRGLLRLPGWLGQWLISLAVSVRELLALFLNEFSS